MISPSRWEQAEAAPLWVIPAHRGLDPARVLHTSRGLNINGNIIGEDDFLITQDPHFFFRRHFWNANALIFWWNPQIHHFSDFIGIAFFFGLIHTLLSPSERRTLSFGLHVVWGWFSRRSRTALPITRSTFSNEGILHHPVRYCPHGQMKRWWVQQKWFPRIFPWFPLISQ